MKKILALLAVVLGVVSCQTEPEGLDVNVGGEVETTVCVSLPEATRANSALGAFGNVDLGTEGDSKTIRYILKIYQLVDGQYVASNDRQVEYSDGKTVTFPVRLVPNRDYRFVVWADYVVSKNDEDYHYNTEDLANITLNGNWDPMDETRDAFTGYFDTVEKGKQYTSTSSINITLKRPFAKLRVITTDMVELGYLGITPAYATVEYTTPYRAGFNALTSEAFDAGSEKKAHSTVFEIKNYDDVSGANKVLFTDYFFAEEGDAVSFILDVYEDEAKTKLIKSNNFSTDIAVQRNYLTTIQGNILTDGNNVKVDVEDAFANAGNLEQEPYYYQTISSEAELFAAIENGGEYIVISDIDVTGLVASTQAATRTTGTTTTINLNGKTITLKTDIEIPVGKTVIFNNEPTDEGNDEGSIVSVNGSIVNNGTLNIEGGNFGEGTIKNNGQLNVNGGDVDEEAVENGEYAIVGSFIYSAEELQTAVENAVTGTANEFTLAANITGEVVVIQKPNVKITINGADHKFDGKIKVHSNSNHYPTAALTIKNVKFETSQKSLNFIEALENGAQRYSTNITAENCTFTATGEAVNTAVGVQIKASKWANVLNCTATDMHSLLQANSCGESVVVKDCTINGKGGVSFTQVKAATVEGTTITALEYGIRFSGNIDNYGIVVKDNNVTAAQPFIVRKMTGKNNTITLEGENTLTSTGEAYQIVITNGADDAEYVKPTGTYTLTGADNFIVYPRDVVSSLEEFTAALKDANVGRIILGANITVTENWDNRYNGAKVTRPITIDGNGKTLKFACKVDDKNYMAAFRFEAAAVVKNLTIDMSEVCNKAAAISTKGNIDVDKCTFIGSTTYTGCRGVRFGEGAGVAVSDVVVSVTNSTFTNLGRGITDNENGQDAKSVTITNNVCNNAHVYVSAHDSIVFTGNTMNSSAANFRSYTSATDAIVVATDNTLDPTMAEYCIIRGFVAANVECQDGFTIY